MAVSAFRPMADYSMRILFFHLSTDIVNIPEIEVMA